MARKRLFKRWLKTFGCNNAAEKLKVMRMKHIGDATLEETIAFFEKKLGIMQKVVDDALEAESNANEKVCALQDLIGDLRIKSELVINHRNAKE